ncbi:MAG: cytochrome c oxidase subunit II [Mariniblastus sp.]
MNWQLPMMLAQSDPTGKTVMERLQATTQDGTTVPDSALERTGTSNPFATEYWFPEQASSFAGEVDFLYMAIFWISLVFFIAIVGVMVYFCIKYRRKDGVIAPEPSSSHNTAIEILWSVLPSILLVWMFYVGAESYFTMRIPKENAEEIQVQAQRYNWLFTYPDGDTSAELHLVLDRPVKLIMQSPDVLHSFYVPAFRQKMDIVPGRYTYAYLEPNKVGTYRLSCNEYCGQGHSKMRTAAIVHATAEDRKNNTKWIEKDHQPWENGQRIYQIQCSGCHKIDGVAATGPALNLIWGEMENLDTGDQVLVDDNYVLESIWYPNKKIVAGYAPKMNSFKSILTQKQVSYVIAYLKKLKEETAN